MVLIRVDVNNTIATGHLMRCLTIANRLRENGEEVYFCMADEEGVEKINAYHFPYIILNTKWNKMEEELSEIKRVIQEYNPSYIIVDSYQVTKFYLGELEKMAPVLYIDDLSQEVYPVSSVLHYSDWQEQKDYCAKYLSTETKILYGLKYVPLREEFYLGTELREKKILITTGGTDTYNVTKDILEMLLQEKNVEEYSFCVIIGGRNQNKAELEKMAAENARINVYYDVKNMGDYMRSCEVAISAGGTTIYELLACGIPIVAFSFALNQTASLVKYGERGWLQYAGSVEQNKTTVIQNIKDHVVAICRDNHMQNKILDLTTNLVDGQGAERIAKFLIAENK